MWKVSYDSISLSRWIETGVHPLFHWVWLCSHTHGSVLNRRMDSAKKLSSAMVCVACAQGNHAARLALDDILQKSHELHPSTTTAQSVDDLATADAVSAAE